MAGLVTAAILMGAPGIRGGFLSGDDIQLARDHVLVNRPSIAHAAQLFRIVHRDLYQPVALLSLSLDFAVARAIPVTAGGSAEANAAAVAHLTNVLLHAANAVLVFLLIRRVSNCDSAAFVTGLLVALHPLNAECVAWISGRMMLLSTQFVLAALIVLDSWRERGGAWRVILGLTFVVLAMMSKVRVELPALLLIPLLYRRASPPRRWWAMWAAASAITVAFAALNLATSRGMIERGEHFLGGPRIVRTLLALAWYLSRVVWPAGLAPFHPTPQVVTWSEPGLALAAAIVLVVTIGAVASWRRTRGVACGSLWFLAAIAVTLPLIPARNLAYAERYTYLPNVGLFSVIAAAYAALNRHTHNLPAAGALRLGGAAVLAGLLLASWRTASDYHDDMHRAARVAAVYPQFSETQLRYAGTLLSAGKFAEAADVAHDAERRFGPAVRADVLQIVGASRLRLGDQDAALAAFREAVALAPEDGRAWGKLGAALAETGDNAGAIEAYEHFAKLLPNQNPDLLRLAQLYRRSARPADAARVYQQVLTNNPYDAIAALALAELDMTAGRHREALARLDALLAWMPECAPAHVDRGAALLALGQPREALAEYETAVALDPLMQQVVLCDAADFDRFAGLLQARAEAAPADPWPYLLLARACADAGRTDLAALAVAECRKRTTDPAILGKLPAASE